MAGAFRQVGTGEMRGGDWRPIARTAMYGVEFTDRFGVELEGSDGRWEASGAVAYATIELPAGEQFVLEQRLDAPTSHVVIYGLPDADRSAQLSRFADALGLPRTDLRPAPAEPWPCRVRFPDYFAEQAAVIEAKGWFADLVVEAPDGRTYRPVFYDPVRLGQEVTDELGRGARLFREPNLVVIPRLTEGHMLAAISHLYGDDFAGLLPEPPT